METKPYWKKIWYVVAMRSKSVLHTDIEQVLEMIKNDVFKGICTYGYYTDDSFIKWKESISAGNLKLEKLLQRCSHDLNVDCANLWGLFCNYLMFEYNGKIEDVAAMANYEIHLNSLVQALYQFYSCERSYLLHSLTFILQKCLKYTKYSQHYVDFVNNYKISNIRKDLFAQLNHLIQEINNESVSKHSTDFYLLQNWVNRNYNEQFHVLLCILLTCELKPMEFDEMRVFTNICLIYSCTQLLPFDGIQDVIDQKLQQSVMFLEYAVLIIAFDNVCETDGLSRIGRLIEDFDKRHKALIVLWTSIGCNHAEVWHKEDNINQFNVPERVASRANDNHVYEILSNLLSCNMIMESVAGPIIQKWIYKLFEEVSITYKGGLHILNKQSINLIVKTLEKNPELVNKCLNSGTTSSIFCSAARMFPYDFFSFSRLLNSIAAYEQHIPKIIEIMLNLNLYTEKFDEAVIENEVRAIDVNYTPRYRGNARLSEIPPLLFEIGTEACLWNLEGRDLVTYTHKYNYFCVLADYFFHMAYIESEEDLYEQEVDEIITGLDLITTIIKSPYLNKERISNLCKEFNYCIYLITGILTKGLKFQKKNLIMASLRVFVGFTRFNLQQTVDILLVLNFLPNYTNYELTLEYAIKKESLTESLLFAYVHEEALLKKTETLQLYLEFFEFCFKKNAFYKKVLMPGLTFIFTYVFNHYLEWEYEDEYDKHLITIKCLEILFNVVQKDPQTLNTKEDKQIYVYVINCFKEHCIVLNTYITLIRTTYADIINMMLMKEVNWEEGKYGLILFKILQYTLSMLMIFLNKYEDKNGVYKYISDQLFSLEFSPNMVKIIVGIMMQNFDMNIKKLSCRLLNKIVEKYNVPLMAYLDMDQTQIQGAFLQKLRDPVEDDELKLLILDFISSCVVYKQHGMCAAFFNINTVKCNNKAQLQQQESSSSSSSGKEQPKMGDSVTNFMIEHLKSLVRANAYLSNPLQSSMLNLFHTLWSYQRSILIEDLIKQEDFWPLLADPLFKPLIIDDPGYGQILDVITLEITRLEKKIPVDKNLLIVLKRIFNINENFLENWHRHILASIEADKIANKPGMEMNSLKMIWAWKNFLMIVVQNVPEIFAYQTGESKNSCKVKISVSEYCLKGLYCHLSHFTDVRVLRVFSELYFFCLNEWKINCYGNIDERLEILSKIYVDFDNYIEMISSRNKEAILGIAAKTLIDIKEDEKSLHKLEKLELFLSSVIPVVHKEYKILNSMTNKGTMSDLKEFTKAHRNWNSIILFGTSLLQLPKSEKFGWWFKSAEFLQKVMYFVGLFIEHLETMHCAKVAISFLVKYAESPLINDFAFIDMKDFYYNMTPPSYYDIKNITLEKFNIDELEEWWYTCRGILALNLRLMQKLDILAQPSVFYLFTLQLDLVKHLMQLPHVTAEASALKLVKMLLLCFNMSLKWKDIWHAEFNQELKKMVEYLCELMNQCVLILLRPKMISAYRLDDKNVGVFLEQIPDNTHIHVIEEIVDILGLVLQCFIRINPPIIEILEFYRPRDTSMLEVHNATLFPVVGVSSLHTLFHALHFLCKASSLINTRRSTVLKCEVLDDSKRILMLNNARFFIFVTTEMISAAAIYERVGTQTFFKHKDLTGMSAPWLSSLNVDIVNNALEKLVGFLTQQIYFTTAVSKSIFQGDILKRKLQGELQVFHDYSKKKLQQEAMHHVLPHALSKKPNLNYSRRRKEFESDSAFRHSFSICDVDESGPLMENSADEEYLLVISILLQKATKLTLGKLL